MVLVEVFGRRGRFVVLGRGLVSEQGAGPGQQADDRGSAAGGWWKNNRRQDRIDVPVRYSLILSLRTPEQGVDLYTPIATQLRIPIETEITTE
ncbi:hypothetical protein [Mycobacterium sp. C31M]